ncbi:MAG TPA: hypothetical protein VH877_00545 [Polyangia bacterium]|jgi:hypothetical protein|nr:hypothetical protein [Polyangia bacterium]
MMSEKERLQELHLALEGAVDQLARAHRLAVGDVGQPSPELERIDRVYGEVVALRNEVRDSVLGLLGRPPGDPGAPQSQ